MSVQGIPRTSPGLRVAEWARRGRAEVFSRSHVAVTVVAAAVILGLPLLALVMPYPHSPLSPDPNAIAVAPNGTYWFGTDGNGMDVFSRTIEAAKLDLPIAIGATALALVVGVPLGLFATSGRVGDTL